MNQIMIDAQQFQTLLDAVRQPPLPVEIDLWSADEIARYMKRERRTVMESYACLPSFPKAIRLPTKGVRGQPLWKANEVIRWAEAHQER
jgi:hypothetical protein